MRCFILPLMITLISTFPAWSQTKKLGPIEKDKFHFNQPERQDTAAGYAQAVRTGNTLYISGTVTTEKSEKGVAQVYANIQKTLEHYGAGMQHVVKENLYTTDIEMMKSLNHARKPFYKGDFPAATWVQISRLYMEEAWLEVEVVAVLPGNKK